MSKEPDPIWEVMVLLFGIPIGRNERGRRNKRVAELKEMQAELGLDTAEMVARIAEQYQRAIVIWPAHMVTENSLVTMWSRFNSLPSADVPAHSADWTLDAAAVKGKEL